MKCPYCGGEESKVIDSRPTEDGERIRRRRECLVCRKRFTTYEAVETLPLMVIKKDNSREAFDRQKVLNGMLRSCAQRPVSYEQLETAVNNIEQTLLSGYDREVSSVRIGELTMQERIEEHWWTLNAMLGDCGMALLDPRNVNDWLILYAIGAAGEEASMSERLEQVIALMYENV